MLRKISQLALVVLLSAWPALAAQQNPQPPAGTPRSSKPGGSPGESSSKTTQPTDDSTPNRSTADEDINVGIFYLHKGDEDAAIPRFDDAVRKQPKLAKPRLLLAEAYEKKGDKRGAARCYEEYLQAFPDAADRNKIQKRVDKLTSEQ